ncbi:MAG: dihydropteroate synthase [Planctomycetota bacterium]
MPVLDWRLPGDRRLSLTTTGVMGVLNVTPDSFSDGGRFVDADAGRDIDTDAVVAEGVAMAEAGAAVIDVGGESSRPGAERIDADEQRRRVVEPIRQLRAALDDAGHAAVAISIDTTRAAVADAAIDADAAIVNDISAGRDDGDAIFAVAAERNTPLILMHMRGQPATMQQDPRYDGPGGVVGEVERFLLDRAQAAEAAGVPRERIAIDPGIGFGKTVEHNRSLLRALPRFVGLGYPVMLGASRKRFIAAVSPKTGGDAADRVAGTCVVTAWAGRCGVAVVRVHDVAANRQALDVEGWLKDFPEGD